MQHGCLGYILGCGVGKSLSASPDAEGLGTALPLPT